MPPRKRPLALYLLLAFTGCELPEESTEPPAQEELNPDKPNANELIQSQTSGGSSLTSNSLLELISSGNGDRWLRNRWQDEAGWTDPLDKEGESVVRAVQRVSLGNTGQDEDIITAGYVNIASAQREGRIVVIGADGTPKSETAFSHPGISAWFNSITVIDRTADGIELLAAGGSNSLNGVAHLPLHHPMYLGT